jgi:hypothetical protein
MPSINARPTGDVWIFCVKDRINEALNEGVIGEEKRIMLEDLQWLVDSFLIKTTITILLNVLYSNVKFWKSWYKDAFCFTDEMVQENVCNLYRF